VAIEGSKSKLIVALAGDSKNLDAITNITQLAGEALCAELYNLERGGPCGNSIPLIQIVWKNNIH